MLIRALEPVRGIAKMKRRRLQENPIALCSGPGKLSEALAVRGTDHGIDLCASAGRGFLPRKHPVEVVSDVRIGISKAAHLPWRFLQKGSPFVSVQAALAVDPLKK